MRGRTAELHRTAECSGFVGALLGGSVHQSTYALYLRNLLPAYQAMEGALQKHRDRPEFRRLAQPVLYRAAKIAADLDDLAGPDWTTSVPLLSSGARYAARVVWAGDRPILIAHCYTRYLGDLNGGRRLGQRLMQQFGEASRALAFTSYPEIQDLDGFRIAYRRDLDRAGEGLADLEAVVEEAAVAFELNIQLSLEVDAFRWHASAGRAG